MEDLSQALEEMMRNPQLMQTVAAMAQSLGQSAPPPQEEPASPSLPNLDPALLQALGSMAGSAAIDPQQRTLLSALKPYLSADRLTKLEKAMRAAHLARAASSFLNSGGMKLLTGR